MNHEFHIGFVHFQHFSPKYELLNLGFPDKSLPEPYQTPPQ